MINKRDLPVSSILDYFDRKAANEPHRAAICYEDETLTYGFLNELAAGLANKLTDKLKPVTPGDEWLAGVLMYRSPQLLVSILAIWKTGGAFIPLDPGNPIRRTIEVIKDSNAGILITQDSFLNEDLRNSFKGMIVDVDNALVSIPSNMRSVKNPGLDIKPERLAYVIYTSGSTGRPKGAMVEHGGMINHIRCKIDLLEITQQDVVAQSASHTFDIFVWQMFAPLCMGGKTIIYDQEIMLNLDGFVAELVKNDVAVLEAVPAYLSAILQCMTGTSCPIPELRCLMSTGEALKQDLAARCFEVFQGIKLVNAYGPTEASDDVTHYVMTRPPGKGRIPIGHPVPGHQIYIVNEDMTLCPPGVEGEIWVSGVGVGRGYLNDPLKTARQFMENPFERNRQRLYKTGDLGLKRNDGTFDFIGRKDMQVKVRGIRIELAEIENLLLGCTGVRDAVVIAHRDKQDRLELCAFPVMEFPNRCKTEKVKDFLRERLPRPMIPSRFIPLTKLPLAPNGKTDTLQLHAIAGEKRVLSADMSPPVLQLPYISPDVIDALPLENETATKRQPGERLAAKEPFESLLGDTAAFIGKTDEGYENVTLIARFEKQAGQYPDRIALVHGEVSLTYGMLNADANKVACYLRRNRAAANNVVGFMMDSSTWLITGLLGSLKAGCAFLSIGLDYPAEKRRAMLESVNVQWVLKEIDIETIVTNEPPVEIKAANRPDDLAYIVFTSGSTGMPNASAISHRSFSNLVLWFVNEFELGFDDRCLSVTSVSFDLTLKNIFASLIKGGKLYIHGPGYFDAPTALNEIYGYGITSVNCTASMFYRMVGVMKESEVYKLKGLRYFFSGGESLSIGPLFKWLRHAGFVTEIVNTYGPSECTGVSAFFRVKKPLDFLNQPVPIGGPIYNARLYVLDSLCRPVAPGETGELYIAGTGLGQGYVNNPELSAEKFILIPGAGGENKEERLYRTGDQVSPQADGNLIFKGRIDYQFKLRGLRIEPGEIECALMQLPGIREAAVLLINDLNGDACICAFIVGDDKTDGDVELSIESLKRGLALRLPKYMIPVCFVRLERMPLTDNGKIDRKRLRNSDVNMFRQSVNKERENDIQEQLAGIWADILGIPGHDIDIDADFFQLGGHSLNVALMVSKIRSLSKRTIPIKSVFHEPTIRQLAKYLAPPVTKA